VAALLPFASVHAGNRVVVALLCAILAGVVSWVSLGVRKLRRSNAWLLAFALGVLALSSASFIPLGPAGRAVLQPALAGPVNEVLALVERPRHCLAMDPRRALDGMLFASAALLVCLATVATVRSFPRATRMAWALLTIGVATVLLAGLHRVLEASRIYWISEVPAYAPEPFFAPFVNPNHGGAACAAILPLGLVLVTRGQMPQQLAALGGTVILGMGIWASGSRGAWLEAGAAVLVLALLQGRRLLLRVALAAIVAGIGALAVSGPAQLALRFSQWISPDATGPDLLLGRDGLWSETLRMIGGAPWLGVGMGGFVEAYKVIKSRPEFSATAHAHQDYLQALAELGVLLGSLWIALALAPFLWAAWRCTRMDKGRRRSQLAAWVAGGTALLISCLFDFSMHIGALAVLAALLAGVCLARAARRGPSIPWWWPPRVAVASLCSLCIALFGIGKLADRDAALPWASASMAVERGDAAWERAAEQAARGQARQEALAWYQLALSRTPLDPETLYKLARAEWGESTERAAAVLELSTRVYPTMPWTWLHLAKLHRQLGRSDLAVESYRQLLSLDLPTDQTSSQYLEEVLELGEEPRMLFEKVLPQRDDRIRDAARLVARRGDREYAEELFLRALELNPDGGAAYASWLLRWGRAEEAYELVKGRQGGCTHAQVAGDALLALKRYEEALERLQVAQRECGSDNRAVRLALARARLGLGQDGIPILEQLLREKPEAHRVRRTLVQALRQKGRTADTVEHLEYLVLEGEARPHEVNGLLKLLRNPPRPTPGFTEVD